MGMHCGEGHRADVSLLVGAVARERVAVRHDDQVRTGERDAAAVLGAYHAVLDAGEPLAGDDRFTDRERDVAVPVRLRGVDGDGLTVVERALAGERVAVAHRPSFGTRHGREGDVARMRLVEDALLELRVVDDPWSAARHCGEHRPESDEDQQRPRDREVTPRHRYSRRRMYASVG